MTSLAFFIRFVLVAVLVHYVDECGTDDTCRNGNHRDSNQADETAEQSSESCDGVDVAIAHRRKRDNRPPETVADVFKYFRLGFSFQIVHQNG